MRNFTTGSRRLRHSFAALAAAAVLSACAGSFYQPTARAHIVCEGARCDKIWQRAQTWLATNGRYRIQIANDAIVQTYGPHKDLYDSVAYTVTKEARADGKTLIVIHGACHGGSFGCVFDPSVATNKLYHELVAIQ